METVTITKEQWRELVKCHPDDNCVNIRNMVSWGILCEIGTVHETEEDYDEWRLENLKGHIKDQPEAKDPEPSQETDYKYMSNEDLFAIIDSWGLQERADGVAFEAELRHRLKSHKVPEKPLTEVGLLDAYLQLEQDTNGSVIERTNLRLKILDMMGATDETDEQMYHRGLVKGY